MPKTQPLVTPQQIKEKLGNHLAKARQYHPFTLSINEKYIGGFNKIYRGLLAVIDNVAATDEERSVAIAAFKQDYENLVKEISEAITKAGLPYLFLTTDECVTGESMLPENAVIPTDRLRTAGGLAWVGEKVAFFENLINKKFKELNRKDFIDAGLVMLLAHCKPKDSDKHLQDIVANFTTSHADYLLEYADAVVDQQKTFLARLATSIQPILDDNNVPFTFKLGNVLKAVHNIRYAYNQFIAKNWLGSYSQVGVIIDNFFHEILEACMQTVPYDDPRFVKFLAEHPLLENKKAFEQRVNPEIRSALNNSPQAQRLQIAREAIRDVFENESEVLISIIAQYADNPIFDMVRADAKTPTSTVNSSADGASPKQQELPPGLAQHLSFMPAAPLTNSDGLSNPSSQSSSTSSIKPPG